MNNKVNILEEISKMKNLIDAKAGTVISEQTPFKDIQTSVDAFNRASYGMLGTNISGIKNVLNSIPDKNTFILFFNKINTDSGKSLGRHIADELESGNATEALDIANIIKTKFGVDVDSGVENGVFKKRFRILWDQPKPDAEVPATDAEAPATDGKVPAETPKPTGPTPTQRLATTAKSLGVENPQMDVATLQKILDTLNASSGAVTESKKSVNEELNTMKYLLGYQRGKVISEQDAVTQSTATPKDLITQIQTVLKTKYNANLGNYGPNKDGIDGKWGNISQTALETALKTAAETKQKADELSQRRAAETQQTATQDTATQQAVDKGSQNIMNANLQVQAANTPGVKLPDLYTTLVNNKTLVTRPNGNIVYKGVDLTSTQRQELETKLKTMGYNLSTDNRDKTYGDKLIFKKNQ